MSKARKKLGLAPGSVVFTGNRKVDNVLIHYVQYNATQLVEKVLDSHEQCILDPAHDHKVDWYDIRGMHDVELINFVGETFSIHPLIQEAFVHTSQRPNFDEFENGIFITLKALSFDTSERKVHKEHVAIFFNNGFVLTAQETESDLFSSVRERISLEKGRIRKRGADYLAYALIDAIVDHYYVVLEEIEDVIESVEEQMITTQEYSGKSEIHHLKKELLVLRKAISPLREAISRFAKTENELVNDSSKVYVRDLYEHTVQIMDTVESYRDIMNGLQDLFISEVSFKMNKVMQLLTLISAVFIPLTFLAGIYGMNFQNMPELNYKYGYFILLGVMLILFAAILVFFRRKKWL